MSSTAVFFGFDHIYSWNYYWKTSFFLQRLNALYKILYLNCYRKHLQLLQFLKWLILRNAKFWSLRRFSLSKKAYYTNKKIECRATQNKLNLIICIGPCMINFPNVDFTSCSYLILVLVLVTISIFLWIFINRRPTCSNVRCNCIFARFLQFLYVFFGLLFLCLSICSLNKFCQDSYSESFSLGNLYYFSKLT